MPLGRSLFTDDDRARASARLGAMVTPTARNRRWWRPRSLSATARSSPTSAHAASRRVAKHKPPLTPEQVQSMLDERAAQRARGT